MVYEPEWAIALDMAHGDPLRAKKIFEELDGEWYSYWTAWKRERARVGVPDSIVGMYAEKK